MDLQNLKEHHEELLSFMENNGYCSTYIYRFRDEINRILADADSHRWQSYQDIYLECGYVLDSTMKAANRLMEQIKENLQEVANKWQ